MDFKKLQVKLRGVFSDQKITEDFARELQNSPADWFDGSGKVKCIADDTGEEFFISPHVSLRVLSIVVQSNSHPSMAGVFVRVFAAIGGTLASEGEKHGLHTPAHGFVKMYYDTIDLTVYSMDFYSSQFEKEKVRGF